MTDSSAAQESRTRVLSAIETAEQPISVETITELTGLHANTVRGHLDVLLAREAVAREPADAQGRGRPRWLYRPGDPRRSPYQSLAEALTVQLGRVNDPAMAEEAAARWAQALPPLPDATSPDEAVQETAAALERLGFGVAVSGAGDAIELTGCPYAAIVEDNPVVCDIHAALVVRLLDQTGQPVSMESMEVWTRPGLCVARLGRPDIRPDRSIAPDGSGSMTERNPT